MSGGGEEELIEQAPIPAPGSTAGDIQHVKNNSGKKNNAVYTPVLSLGDNRYEVLDKGGGASVEEEVAGMVSRLVHFIAFDEASKCNAELLMELEDYQKECWERERGKEKEERKKRKKKDPKKPEKASKRAPLEDELYFTPLGLSLSSSPSTGFSSQKIDKAPKFTRYPTENLEPTPSTYGSPILPGPTGVEDAFTKKLTELQWLQADTLRTERAYTGRSAQSSAKDDQPTRSRTPTKIE